MEKKIKSGKEVLDEFITSIKNNNQLDKNTVDAVTKLYDAGKLSKINLTNALSDLRDKHETK